jgi:hypothetical protein
MRSAHDTSNKFVCIINISIKIEHRAVCKDSKIFVSKNYKQKFILKIGSLFDYDMDN